MATWVELSIDAFKAASRLRPHCPRSSISRAYYAAYAAVTNELKKAPGVTLDYGNNNPSHGKLTNYIQEGFLQLGHPQSLINVIDRAIRELKRDRERSDYMPGEDIDESDARANLHRAESIILNLGLPL